MRVCQSYRTRTSSMSKRNRSGGAGVSFTMSAIVSHYHRASHGIPIRLHRLRRAPDRDAARTCRTRTRRARRGPHRHRLRPRRGRLQRDRRAAAARRQGPHAPVAAARAHPRAADARRARAARSRSRCATWWPSSGRAASPSSCSAQPSLDWDLGETRGTVALRMPDSRIALELLQEVGPLAVSSANSTGDPAAMDVDAAERMLGDSVAVYLDGGPARRARRLRGLDRVDDRRRDRAVGRREASASSGTG